MICEQFAEQRVGAGELTFWEPGQYEVVGEAPTFTVHSGFVEPATGRQTEMLCTVTDDGEQWRLNDMQTNRLTDPPGFVPV